MTNEQIELLFKAAQSPMIPEDVRQRLSVANPWTMKGHTAEVMQREVARLSPLQARLWAKEAGASMSLAAAAAAQGLQEMRPELQDEIQRMNPQTEDEARNALVAQLTANGNPYQKKGSYDEQGKFQEAPYNLTACMRLEMEAPEVAARLKKEATPPEPAHNFSDREASILMQHGYSLPS